MNPLFQLMRTCSMTKVNRKLTAMQRLADRFPHSETARFLREFEKFFTSVQKP